MYFQKFPNIYYEYNIGGRPVLKVVKDISTNVRFRVAVLENITLFDEYDIREGETPEIIAHKVYGSSEYHWIVMLCNQRFNYVKDFPLPYDSLNSYINEMYPDNTMGIHHYENEQGFVVNSNAPGAFAVTNYDHEVAVNETKRRIKLISPQLLANILTQFNTII
jgi:alpha-amylase/alpha-mannosidase (GH57 family)